jgi:hypothetical protein
VSALRTVELTDPTAPAAPGPIEALSDRLVGPYLKDPRDVVFTRLAARMFTQLLPLTVAMYLAPTWLTALLGIPYVAYLFLRFGGPTVLGLHAVTHRPLFIKPHDRYKAVITHVLPLFVGMPPFAYRAHHVLMHHAMENAEDDLTSTAAYQRDKLLHFAHYWLRFAVFGYWHMRSWLIRRGQAHLLWGILLGDLAVYAVALGLLWLDPVAALFTFWIPYAMLRFFLMAGNWTEHAFVDVEAPGDRYRNSTNLLNTPYNHRSYNAGYHLLHHVLPGLHWADTVPTFDKRLPQLVERGAITFDGVRNNQQIWWKLMSGDYGFLADRLVDWDGRWADRDARIAFLKGRVQQTVGTRKGLIERRERPEPVRKPA